jgi:Zn-dependent peptidase ImmA (M78 family)
MQPARTDAARDAAARIRHERGLGTGFVDIFRVLKLMRIELYMAPFPYGADALEGAHMVKDGQAFVFVNNERAITRQRLTAAHELGHHELDNPTDGSAIFESGSADQNDAIEQNAYRFARFFLMDPEGVGRLVDGMKDYRQMVAAVAATFVVSPEVAAIHLQELGLISVREKLELMGELAEKTITPSALLKRYGYRMAYTDPNPTEELDETFVGRTIEAYAREWITLAALADALQITDTQARELLKEMKLPIREPEA